jgi:glycosyltransferase involved in cell wall biosynthesis
MLKMRIALLGPFSGPSLLSAFGTALGGQTLPPGYPGAPLMATLAKALVERGHWVATITTDYSTAVSELEPFRKFAGRGIEAYFCPQRPHSFRSAGGRRGRALDLFLFERNCLRSAIADSAPDVVHAHWTYEFAWAALDCGLPTLVTAHDSPGKVLRYMPEPYRLVRYFMARRVLARCSHLTTVSPALARDLLPMTRADMAVVANPIAEDVLATPGCNAASFDSKKVVMVLNGWGALKNGANALRAFALARQHEPSLRLVCFGSGFHGDGPAFRWARAHGLATGVEFRGPVPHRAILEQLSTSMLLLHPSRLESFGMSVAEAMAVGLPAVAGRSTASMPWLLDDGRAGVLVDVNDPRAIAQEMVALSGDRARWQALSSAARTRATQIFAASAVAARYEEVYSKLLPQGSPHALSELVDVVQA